MVFARCIHNDTLEDEFLFCETISLEKTTKAIDIFKKVDDFFEKHGLLWENCCGVCTDSAPAMIDIKSGFKALVLQKNDKIKFVHCMIHKQAFVSNSMSDAMRQVMDEVIRCINYVKARAQNGRLCSTMQR